MRLNLREVKQRARKKRIPFTITINDLALPDKCMFTGKALKYGAQNDWDAASIDRIFPDKGYVPGNVRIISRLANMVRFNCTDPALFRALAEDAESLQP